MTGTRLGSRFSMLAMLLLAACANRISRQPRTEHRAPAVLRVCADPNNLPFSNEQQQGFENKIADLIARDMNARVAYTWWPQRRGFVRMTLKRGDCDVIMGVPSNYEQAQPTEPYYRSSYVFVSRRDRRLAITSLDDPRLRRLRVGVQIIGNDHVNSPPAHALNARGIVNNLVGYSVLGDYRTPNPPRAIIDAVGRGDVDVAIAWGPLAGYFARQQNVPLDITPLSPQIDLPFLPFVFDISMGVRRGDVALKETLDKEIERRRDDIDRILDQYGVPRV